MNHPNVHVGFQKNGPYNLCICLFFTLSIDLSLLFQQITADISNTKLHAGGPKRTKKKPKQGNVKKGAPRRKKKSGDSKEKSSQGKHNETEQNGSDTSKDKLEDYAGCNKEDTCPTLPHRLDSPSEDNICQPQDGSGKEARNFQKELKHEIASTDIPTENSENPSDVNLPGRKKHDTEENEIDKTVTNELDLYKDNVVDPAVTSNCDQILSKASENISALSTSSKSNATKNISSSGDHNSSTLPDYVIEEQTLCNGALNQQSSDSDSEHTKPPLSLTERLMQNHRSHKKETKSRSVRRKQKAVTSVNDADVVDLTSSQSENEENISPASSNDTRFKTYRYMYAMYIFFTGSGLEERGIRYGILSPGGYNMYQGHKKRNHTMQLVPFTENLSTWGGGGDVLVLPKYPVIGLTILVTISKFLMLMGVSIVQP